MSDRCFFCPDELVPVDDAEYPLMCPACCRRFRVVEAGGERSLMSKPVAVRLRKRPEPGDRYTDCIEPDTGGGT